MKNKFLLAIAITTALGLTAAATTAVAAPLPVGTKLTITPWVNSPTPLLDNGVGCPYGSCFGMGVIAGFFSWTALEPGTDGGIIIGKAQKGGGQDTDLTSTLSGELTAMWDFGGNHGTFHTFPSDAGNVFDNASCFGVACGSNTTPRLTNLAVWNTAWGGLSIPMGAAAGCDKVKLSNCTVDQVAGIFVNSWTIDPVTAFPRNYELKYSQVVPSVFANFPFRLILRGPLFSCNGCGIIIVTINGSTAPASLLTSGAPVSFTIAVSDPDGPTAPTCRAVFTGPVNGAVNLNGCTGGTYTPDLGFVGSNSFAVIANDSLTDSFPANGGTVNVAVVPPLASPTPTVVPEPTITPLISPTPTTVPTNPPSPTACTDKYPVSQVTLVGKQGHLTVVVTGNITKASASGKEIKICPSTKARYTATTNTPDASVVCKVKSHTTQGEGRLKVNDEVKCSDKPVGNDKVKFKIKSGEYKKAT